MASATWIETEAKKAMTVAQELTLALAVHAKAGSPVARARLAGLLLLADQQNDLIALLEGGPALSFAEELMLAEAYLSRETPEDNARAHSAADRALALAESDAGRARALAARGKCETRTRCSRPGAGDVAQCAGARPA